MNKLFLFIPIAFISATTSAQHTHSPMQNETDSMSYSVGMNIANSLKNGGIDTMNYDLFLEAVKDVLEYSHVKMDATAANQVVNNFVTKKKEEQVALATAEGTAFLQANLKKKGVKVTPSGLQYKIIIQGDGPIPVDGQRVTTHYTGTLINGTKFDSSVDRGQPTTFGVNQVIKGWTEALKMMPVGSKWELYIPQELAYGERAMGANIPAYSTLIFTIELLEIVE